MEDQENLNKYVEENNLSNYHIGSNPSNSNVENVTTHKPKIQSAKKYNNNLNINLIYKANKQKNAPNSAYIGSKNQPKFSYDNLNQLQNYDKLSQSRKNSDYQLDKIRAYSCVNFNVHKPLSSSKCKSAYVRNKNQISSKDSPGYLYYKELKNSQEVQKKRLHTSKLRSASDLYKNLNCHPKKKAYPNSYKTTPSYFTVYNNKRKNNNFNIGKNNFNFNYINDNRGNNRYPGIGDNLHKSHMKMMNSLNNPKNPYSTYFEGKLFQLNDYNMRVSGFLNGAPRFEVKKKKKNFNIFRSDKQNYKVIKDKYYDSLYNRVINDIKNKKYNQRDFNDDIDINPEMEAMFGKNMKNFFPRKGIEEVPLENEIEKDLYENKINEENKDNNELKSSKADNQSSESNENNVNIKELPVIYYSKIFKYFDGENK